MPFIFLLHENEQSILDFGYMLDHYVKSDTLINEKELDRYLSLLRHLDKEI